jgi:hypothetical protein
MYSEEDVSIVCSQIGIDKERAEDLLKEVNGIVTDAILSYYGEIPDKEEKKSKKRSECSKD